MKRFVIYRRVSTQRQGRSGLGLEAQDRDIAIYLESFAETPFEVIGAFTDIQSGKSDDNRPELKAALALAKKRRATLLVSKLDRLSRDVEFIARTIKQADLCVASMPGADTTMLHMYAVMAEQERRFISERTKKALAAAKARGTKLGGERGSLQARLDAAQADADAFASKVRSILQPMQERGDSLRQMAAALNEAGVSTRRGSEWQAMSVKRVLERA
jgi:DNA invertase Pin-like site-specific DNA recombinase